MLSAMLLRKCTSANRLERNDQGHSIEFLRLGQQLQQTVPGLLDRPIVAEEIDQSAHAGRLRGDQIILFDCEQQKWLALDFDIIHLDIVVRGRSVALYEREQLQNVRVLAKQ